MATTQIDGNQIKSGAITDTQINASAAIASSKLADGANFLKKDGSVTPTADITIGGFKLTNVATPTTSTDAANKGYVDGLIQGLDAKGSVKAMATANVTVSNPGTSTFDGITLTSGDRLLLNSQTAPAENGIYIFNGSGSALTRATDMDAWTEVPSAYTWVEQGSTNGDSGWVCTADQGGTLGTTAISFTQFNGAGTISAGNGLQKVGSTISVLEDTTSSGLSVTSSGLKIKNNGSSLNLSTSGIKISDSGSNGQVMIGNASNAATFTTLSGDISTITGAGVVTLATTIAKPGTNYQANETPSGTINGSNTTFTLANTPANAATGGTALQLYLNGILQEPGAGNDFTISTNTITMLTAPVSGDKLRAFYWK
jgi:hypothetical protein